MKRIFISTNYDKLGKVIGDNQDEKGIKDLNNDEISLLYFNNSTFNFQTSLIENAILLLVKDTSTLIDSNKTPLVKINKDEDYLMGHSTCKHLELFEYTHTDGMHEQKDPFYTSVFKTIFDDSIQPADKVEEILKVLGFTEEQKTEKNEHESKLNFLHHCLTKSGLNKDEVTNSEWAKLDEYKNLSSQANDGPFGANYISALRSLRDKLLVA
jgi:hypothetical protein